MPRPTYINWSESISSLLQLLYILDKMPVNQKKVPYTTYQSNLSYYLYKVKPCLE